MWKIVVSVFCLCMVFACNNAKHPNKSSVLENSFTPLQPQLKNALAAEAHHYFNTFFGNNFSGGFLLAKHGDIIYEKYQGLYDKDKNVNPETPIHIASVSKTITAAGILLLVQQQLIQLQDDISRFFANFPYTGITVQDLLNHRSGLPNYLYFMEKEWDKTKLATNKDVLDFMINKKPAPYAAPNKTFHYCNTNYVLLALIIEQVTKQSFPDYIKEKIFVPLGMKNSYVFSIKDTLAYTPSYGFNSKPFNLESFDAVYGDKNVYTTPRDLLYWDRSWYNHTLINATLSKQAFSGYSFEKPGYKNYGLGWRIYATPTDTIYYHNGWWHGNNAVYMHCVKDTACIIMLGNKYNRAIYTARKFRALLSANKGAFELEE